jgi:hypothetical protein
MKAHYNGKWVDSRDVSTEKDYKWGSSAWLLILIFLGYGYNANPDMPLYREVFVGFGCLCVLGIATNMVFQRKERPLREKIARQQMMNRNLDDPMMISDKDVHYDLDLK